MYFRLALIVVSFLGFSTLNAQGYDAVERKSSHIKTDDEKNDTHLALKEGRRKSSPADEVADDMDSVMGDSRKSSPTDDMDSVMGDSRKSSPTDDMGDETDSAHGGSIKSIPIDDIEDETESAHGGSIKSIPIDDIEDEADSTFEDLKKLRPIDHFDAMETINLIPQTDEEEEIFYDADGDLFFDADDGLETGSAFAEVHTNLDAKSAVPHCSRSMIHEAKAYFKNKINQAGAHTKKLVGSELKAFIKSVVQWGCGLTSYTAGPTFETLWKLFYFEKSLEKHMSTVTDVGHKTQPLGEGLEPHAKACSLKTKAQVAGYIEEELDKNGMIDKPLRDRFIKDTIRGFMYDNVMPICKDYGLPKAMFKASWKKFGLDGAVQELIHDIEKADKFLSSDDKSCVNWLQKSNQYVSEKLKSAHGVVWSSIKDPKERRKFALLLGREFAKKAMKDICVPYVPVLSDYFYRHFFRRAWEGLQLDYFLEHYAFGPAYDGVAYAADAMYHGAAYLTTPYNDAVDPADVVEDDEPDEPDEGDLADLGLSSF